MIASLFNFLNQIDSFFWGYIAFILIVILGSYFTIKTRFFQIRYLPLIFRNFLDHCTPSKDKEGVHPLRAFFASVGGMIGIGNVVGIITAVQIGGPGALFWVWVAALIGSVIKYSEIYLGLKFRVVNPKGGYSGGPMYFLRHAFKKQWLPMVVCLFLCIYGVEIYQFKVITDSLAENWHINRVLVIIGLLVILFYGAIGGVERIGRICSLIMPLFMVAYVLMGLWIIIQEASVLPGVLLSVFKSAFTGHAAVGGFAGSSCALAIQHGIARAAYSADIGIGFDSIIQSESSAVQPEKQAHLGVFGVCLDSIICTMSILVVLVSGVWKAVNPIDASLLVQTALSAYFPYMDLFMPFFLFILGYTTLIAYFGVGIKCAHFLHSGHGVKLYFFYALGAFVFFSFFDQSHALLIMSLSGGSLLAINLLGIFSLRKHILFPIPERAVSKKTASSG